MSRSLSSAQRCDPAVAAEVLNWIFSRRPQRSKQTFLTFLADSFDYLSTNHQGRWSVTLFRDLIRLNGGWVECLVSHSEGLRVLMVSRYVPTGVDVTEEIALSASGEAVDMYARAPGCTVANLTFDEIPTLLPQLRRAHFAALSVAAVQKPPASTRRAHSPGLIEYVSQVLRRPLLNPEAGPLQNRSPLLPSDGVAGAETRYEGASLRVMTNRFERDPEARRQCIAHYGLRCSVCGMTFEGRYGKEMCGFMHVHHRVPLSEMGQRSQVDPVKDLVPVCPNCHAFLHHCDPPLTPEEARARVEARRREPVRP